MTAFDTAWGLLKGTRRFEYDAGYDYPPDKKAMQVAGMTNREDMVKPGPLPGFVYYSDLFQGIDNKLMTEAEAEKLWPSHIGSKAFLAPTKVGLKRYAEMANWGGFGKPRDTHFDTKRTIDKFTADIAPEMAHEVGHALDSQFREGSFAQREMPAHVLEMATRAAMQDRGGRHTPEPIIPKARSRVLDRIYTGEDYTGSYPTTIQTPYDNPDYQYDITDDKIIAGEPMEIAMRLLKAPQYVLQDAHLPHKPFPDLPEGMPPQNVAMFQEHWGGEEGGAPPKGFHEKYNLHPDAKVSMYDIGRNTTHGWKPGTDQMKYRDDSYANQFKNKLSQVSPDATHVIANTGHSYPIGAALPQGSNINDVQQQQQGFPANQARWDRQRPSYEAIQQPQDKQTGEPMDLAWRLLKDEYEDIPKEEHSDYYTGRLNALPGHKPGCELRLNGYYPDYSQHRLSGECTCDRMCIQCEKKEKWGFPHHDTDLCFDCSEQAAKEGLIEHPLINFMSEHEWRGDNT
jgi:hypothetical protein